MNHRLTILPEERTWAALAHLSGLAGYLIPFGGAVVPIILIYTKSDSPVISTLAKQALVLNIVVFLGGLLCFLMVLTVLLIPLAWLCGTCLSLAAVVLPIFGAIQAADGRYFRYPLVGRSPDRI
ncbi:MAG: DUF4870 domain-containing protein [Planctomycetes bacterium]|nr:DUF4870 domain-containing protein [Planctomycetota bacterium]